MIVGIILGFALGLVAGLVIGVTCVDEYYQKHIYGIPKPLVVKRGTVIDDDCQMPLEDFLKSPYSVGCTGSSYGSAKDT